MTASSYEEATSACAHRRPDGHRHGCSLLPCERAVSHIRHSSPLIKLELLDGRFGANTIAELFGYGRGFGRPSPTDCEEVRRIMKYDRGRRLGTLAL